MQSLFNKVQNNQIETSLNVLSCEFCKTFRNTFFYRTATLAASEIWLVFSKESGIKPSVTVTEKYRIQLKKKIKMNYIKQFHIFFHKKLIYNVVDTLNEMLSFFHRWDHCWKCKVDTHVKKELDVSPWRRTIRVLLEKYISKHRLSKDEDILVVFAFQETKNVFDKNRIQSKIKYHI